MSDSPRKDVSTLVQLQYGDPLSPSFFRRTDSNETQITAKGTYEPDPKIRVAPVTITGTMDEPQRSIDFSTDENGIKDSLTNGEAFSPVRVDVWEYHEETGGSTIYHIFSAKVLRAIRNPKGRAGLWQIRCVGQKARLQGHRSGISMLELCDNTFADGDTCKVDTTDSEQTGTVTDIDKQTVTVSGLTAVDDNFWVAGTMKGDGVEVKILSWNGTDEFTLARIPYAGWLGSTVTLVPGCDNTPAVCGGRWKNLADFLGVGAAMPDYHPVMENPRGT